MVRRDASPWPHHTGHDAHAPRDRAVSQSRRLPQRVGRRFVTAQHGESGGVHPAVTGFHGLLVHGARAGAARVTAASAGADRHLGIGRRTLRARREYGETAFEIGAVAFRALGRLAGADQHLELVLARPAPVFIEGHIDPLSSPPIGGDPPGHLAGTLTFYGVPRGPKPDAKSQDVEADLQVRPRPEA